MSLFRPSHAPDLLLVNLIRCKMFLQLFLFLTANFYSLFLPPYHLFHVSKTWAYDKNNCILLLFIFYIVPDFFGVGVVYFTKDAKYYKCITVGCINIVRAGLKCSPLWRLLLLYNWPRWGESEWSSSCHKYFASTQCHRVVVWGIAGKNSLQPLWVQHLHTEGSLKPDWHGLWALKSLLFWNYKYFSCHLFSDWSCISVLICFCLCYMYELM